MDVRPFFMSDTQAAELMHPRDRALDDPALRAQASAVWPTPPCRSTFDATLGQCTPVRSRIIRTVAQHPLRAGARGTTFVGDRGNRIDQRQQLRDIVRIAPVTMATNGTPWASVIRWCLVPALR